MVRAGKAGAGRRPTENASRRVLVVEDDEDTRKMLVTALSDAGYIPVAALDGKHALRTALAIEPGAIVLDLMLPELSGEEFAREYHAHRETTQAPIVVVSAKRDGEQVARDIGARAFLPKPLDLDQLVARIDATVQPSASARG